MDRRIEQLSSGGGRVARALGALRRGWSPAAETRTSGPADDSVAVAADRDRRDGEHMRRLIAFAVEHDACCIDIGAHRGAVLDEMLRVAPEGHHLAFEPIPQLASELRAAFPGVEIHELALSDHSGTASFAHVHGSAEGWSGLRFRPLPGGAQAEVEQITVRVEPLDSVLDPELAPALIKIDVEGAERQVLEGARRTLTRHHPILIFEHGSGSAEAYGSGPTDVHGLLGELGYRIFDLDGGGPYPLERFTACFHAAERVNFVAHR